MAEAEERWRAFTPSETVRAEMLEDAYKTLYIRQGCAPFLILTAYASERERNPADVQQLNLAYMVITGELPPVCD